MYGIVVSYERTLTYNTHTTLTILHKLNLSIRLNEYLFKAVCSHMAGVEVDAEKKAAGREVVSSFHFISKSWYRQTEHRRALRLAAG